ARSSARHPQKAIQCVGLTRLRDERTAEYAGVRAGDKIVTEPLRFGRGTIAAFGRAGFRLGLQPRREAKRVLRYIIISDGRKVIAPRAGELFLGVEVLEHGADAGLAPL